MFKNIKTLIKYITVATIIMSVAVVLFMYNKGGFSYVERTFKSEKTVKSVIWNVETAGFNIGQYSWIDPFGRVCTQVFTDGQLSSPDCDAQTESTYIPKKLKQGN